MRENDPEIANVKWSSCECSRRLITRDTHERFHSAFYFQSSPSPLIIQTHQGMKTLEPGDLFFAPASMRYKLASSNQAPQAYYTFRIRARFFDLTHPADMETWSMLNRAATRARQASAFIHLNHDARITILDHMKQLSDAWYRRAPGDQLIMRALSFDVLRHVYQALADELEDHDEANLPLEKALWRLQSEFMHPISVDQAASWSGYSRSHFHAIFKKHTGLSFNQYLTEVRIANACSQLIRGRHSMPQIAKAVGYSSLSRFYEAFKSVTSVTPAHYRRINRGD